MVDECDDRELNHPVRRARSKSGPPGLLRRADCARDYLTVTVGSQPPATILRAGLRAWYMPSAWCNKPMRR